MKQQQFLQMDANQLKTYQEAGMQIIANLDESKEDKQRRERIKARKAKAMEEKKEQKLREE